MRMYKLYDQKGYVPMIPIKRINDADALFIILRNEGWQSANLMIFNGIKDENIVRYNSLEPKVLKDLIVFLFTKFNPEHI